MQQLSPCPRFQCRSYEGSHGEKRDIHHGSISVKPTNPKKTVLFGGRQHRLSIRPRNLRRSFYVYCLKISWVVFTQRHSQILLLDLTSRCYAAPKIKVLQLNTYASQRC